MAAVSPWQQVVDDLGELLKSNVASDALQRIAQGFDLALAGSIGKKIKLDSATSGRCAHLGDCRGFGAPNGGGAGFLEVPWSRLHKWKQLINTYNQKSASR